MGDPSQVEDPAKDPQYAEPAVDNMRVQKDEVPIIIDLITYKHNVHLHSQPMHIYLSLYRFILLGT